MEKEGRISKLEEEIEMLVGRSKNLGKEMQDEITKVLTIKAKEYYELTGDFYRVKERDLW